MRQSIFGALGLFVLVAAAIVLYLATFVVDPAHQALVLRFGAPIRVEQDPGLKFRAPLVDNVVYLERRILDLDSPSLEVIASDQKRLIVDAFARYRIVDPLRFYQSVGSIPVAQQRLSGFLTSAVRSVLGEASFTQVVRDVRSDLMGRIAREVDSRAEPLGIQVVDVKIRRADLPEANSQAVYARMETERQREATEIRALGTQIATGITANADRQVTVLLAEANRSAEQTRGAGDARATCIFAEAFGRDPEFYAFRRSMEAYIAGLGDSNTQLVITPDSEFFRYFGSPTGQGIAQAQPGPVPVAPTPGPANSDSVECLAALPPLPETPAPATAGIPPGAEPAGIDVISPVPTVPDVVVPEVVVPEVVVPEVVVPPLAPGALPPVTPEPPPAVTPEPVPPPAEPAPEAPAPAP